MRRLIVLPAAFLILTSCVTKSDLPPGEVLNRSTQANRTLQSAAFDLDILLHLPAPQGTTTIDAVVSGVMQNGGTQLQFDVEAEGSSTAGTNWNTLARFIVAGENEVYVKVEGLTVPPALASFMGGQQPDALTGTWWLLPPADEPAGALHVTPDPRMLRMQTEVIDVTRDNGIVTIDGTPVHHYDVAVNNEKLAAFLSSLETDGEATDTTQLQDMNITGEIWIDAHTYILRRAQWRAENPVPGQEPLMMMSVDIHDHNAELTVSPPPDAQPFPVPSLQTLPITLP